MNRKEPACRRPTLRISPSAHFPLGTLILLLASHYQRMSANATHEFPAPVGGVPDELDFAPSIVFAILYALMVPIAIWRVAHPRSRSIVLLGTSIFSIERLISFSLRARAATDAGFRASVGIETYFQTSYSGGFIAIGQDLVNLLRALLVASTLGGDMVARHKLTPPHVRKAHKLTGSELELAPRATGKTGGEGVYAMEVEVGVGADTERDAASATSTTARTGGPEFADQTKLRQTIRKWLGVASLLFLTAVIVSAVGGGNYKNAVKGHDGALVRSLWYVSTALGIGLLVAAAVTALFACYKLPRVPRTSALWIVLVACLLSVVGIYRITVISHSTTSLFSTGPGSQNSARAKAAFYVLHAAPEFVSIAVLVSRNARHTFGTGPWGDLRARDPQPKPEADLKQMGPAGGDAGALA